MAIINRTRKVNKGGMKVGKNTFGTLHSGNTESDGSGFGKLVFGVVASNGYDTKDMSFEEAYKIFKELGGKKNWAMSKFEEKEEHKEEAEEKPNEKTDETKEQDVKKREETIKRVRASVENKGVDYISANIIEKNISKLGDKEIEVLEVGLNAVVNIDTNGRGRCMGNSISLSLQRPRNMDKEMGYDCAMEVLTHETGHALDHMLGISKDDYIIECAKTSKGELLNNLAKVGGLTNGVKNIERISRIEKQAIWKGLHKETYGDFEILEEKSKKDFGYIEEPYKTSAIENDKPKYVAKKLAERLMDYKRWGYTTSEAVEKAQSQKQLWEDEYDRQVNDYNEKYAKFNEAERNGTNKLAQQRYEEYFKEYTENARQKDILADKQGLLSDFISISTDGKFDAYHNGYYGHSTNYAKKKKILGMTFGGAFSPTGRSCQSECWAEYYQSKIMNVDVALNSFKKLMPTLYNAFEERYNNLLKENK